MKAIINGTSDGPYYSFMPIERRALEPCLRADDIDADALSDLLDGSEQFCFVNYENFEFGADIDKENSL